MVNKNPRFIDPLYNKPLSSKTAEGFQVLLNKPVPAQMLNVLLGARGEQVTRYSIGAQHAFIG